MTANDRWTKTINREPLDRLIFWPKLSGANLNRWGESHRFGTIEDFFSFVGGDRLDGVAPSVKAVHRRCSVETVSKGNKRHTRISTPLGDLTETMTFDPVTLTGHPTEFLLKSREDLARYKFYFDDMEIVPDEDHLTASREKYAESRGEMFAWEAVGESPLMDYVENRAGVADAHLMLFDFQDDVEELFQSWHGHLKAKMRLSCETSPADMLALIENTSTTLISPDQYRSYCYPHIGEYDAICREKGRPLALHMCGFLKGLFPELNRVGPKIFEAFTSPPVGNTSFPTGRKALPEHCLIGGTNAVLWLQGTEEIISTIKNDLDSLPHHRGLVVSSAGVMPPDASPEKIRAVAEFVKTYPARF